MIQITLHFTSVQAAIAALRDIPQTALVGFKDQFNDTPAPAPVGKPADKPLDKPKAEKVADPKPTPSPAPAPAAEAPAPAPENAPSASSSTSVDYAQVQKAAFRLAGLSRDVAIATAQSMGVPNFKALPAERWGEALRVIEAKIAELEAA